LPAARRVLRRIVAEDRGVARGAEIATASGFTIWRQPSALRVVDDVGERAIQELAGNVEESRMLRVLPPLRPAWISCGNEGAAERNGSEDRGGEMTSGS
jgi:hypothetical protein